MILTRNTIESQSQEDLKQYLIDNDMLGEYIKHYQWYYSLKTSWAMEPEILEGFLDLYYWLAEDEIDYVVKQLIVNENHVLGAKGMLELGISLDELIEYLDADAELEEPEYNVSHNVIKDITETYIEVERLTND